MELKSTTHKNRNIPLLGVLADIFPKAQMLDVLEIGPGAAVKFIGRYTGFDAPFRRILKPLETALRRLPLPQSAFENYESVELFNAIANINSLTISDMNPRVVKIARAGLPATANVIGKQVDITTQSFDSVYDVIVCLNVISRTALTDQPQAAKTVFAALAPQGVLAIDPSEENYFADMPAKNLGNGIFQKI